MDDICCIIDPLTGQEIIDPDGLYLMDDLALDMITDIFYDSTNPLNYNIRSLNWWGIRNDDILLSELEIINNQRKLKLERELQKIKLEQERMKIENERIKIEERIRHEQEKLKAEQQRKLAENAQLPDHLVEKLASKRANYKETRNTLKREEIREKPTNKNKFPNGNVKETGISFGFSKPSVKLQQSWPELNEQSSSNRKQPQQSQQKSYRWPEVELNETWPEISPSRIHILKPPKLQPPLISQLGAQINSTNPIRRSKSPKYSRQTSPSATTTTSMNRRDYNDRSIRERSPIREKLNERSRASPKRDYRGRSQSNSRRDNHGRSPIRREYGDRERSNYDRDNYRERDDRSTISNNRDGQSRNERQYSPKRVYHDDWSILHVSNPRSRSPNNNSRQNDDYYNNGRDKHNDQNNSYSSSKR